MVTKTIENSIALNDNNTKNVAVKYKGKSGISLIVLVITIIVMIILAAAIILSISNSGVIEKANKAKFLNDVSSLKEKIETDRADELASKGIIETTDYSSLVPNSLKQFIEVSSGGELLFIGEETSKEATWAKEYGLNTKQQYTLKNSLDELMDLAKKYVEDGNSTEEPNLLALQYIRRNKYAGGNWTTLAGEVDTNFVTYVNSNKTMSTLDIGDLKDPITGEEIDFVHSMASLNVYIKQASSGDPLKQYSCWAGDLCTLTEEVYNWYKAGSYSDEQLKEHTAELLGGISAFGLGDMLADADAINISEIIESGDYLNDVIYDYYYGNNSNCCKTRYTKFATYLKGRYSVSGTDQQKIQGVAYYYLGKHNELFAWVELYAKQLISSYSSIPDIVFTTVSTCFSEYIVERMV